ncbi:MAG: hypothetical protein KBT41_04180, partial [bacterium]|nr:hypothetical protein [Candidatus Colousia faecequi]
GTVRFKKKYASTCKKKTPQFGENISHMFYYSPAVRGGAPDAMRTGLNHKPLKSRKTAGNYLPKIAGFLFASFSV